MGYDRPYQTGVAERSRRSQGADRSARVDQNAPVVSTSQGVLRPPSPAQRTRDDPNLLSPLATILHPPASQGASAADSALAGITQRGSSKKSEPPPAGDPSSPTHSASLSVRSGSSSHYLTPAQPEHVAPIPEVLGPSSGLNKSRTFDPDGSELAAITSQLVAQCTQSVTQILTQNVTQAVMAYLDKRMKAQEKAAQASQAAFEKRILDKVEDDQLFFNGEVQAQKKSISSLCVSVDKVSTEVTKLAEQVKVQHELKADISDNVTPKDLDDVWHRLDALQEAVFPDVNPQPPAPVDPQESPSFVPLHENPLQPTPWIENSVYHPSSSSHSPAFHNALSGSPSSSSSGYQSSATFDPNPLNPPPHTVLPQPADHAQQHLVPAVLASRKQRNLPNISEVDHGGHTSFNMGIHVGTRRVCLILHLQLMSTLHHPTQAREHPTISTHMPRRHPQPTCLLTFHQTPAGPPRL